MPLSSYASSYEAIPLKFQSSIAKVFVKCGLWSNLLLQISLMTIDFAISNSVSISTGTELLCWERRETMCGKTESYRSHSFPRRLRERGSRRTFPASVRSVFAVGLTASLCVVSSARELTSDSLREGEGASGRR